MPIEGHRICKSVTKKGNPCTQIAMNDSEYCKIHDPSYTGIVGQPRKHGYYATVISDEDELSAYLEALSMGHAEALTDMAALQMAKSRIIQRTDIDESTKIELLLRFQEAARRSRESAANIESKAKVADSIKQISWLWEEEVHPENEEAKPDESAGSADVKPEPDASNQE